MGREDMRAAKRCFPRLTLATLAVALTGGSYSAQAHTRHHPVQHGRHYAASWHVVSRHGHAHASGHVIQCVAFAKAESEVALTGNARDWWYNAAGRYARGGAPEAGSVLNFRAIRRMPLGHVAIVTGIVNERVITIDQSHWGQSGVSRNVRVVDVSPDNDWSAVRVELNGRRGTFGSIYPTYGFIYPHGENAPRVMTASAERTTLSPAADQPQVAEASDTIGTVEDGYVVPAPMRTHSHHVVTHRGKKAHRR